MIQLLIKDETATGKTLAEHHLNFTNNQITVRELIQARVEEEVHKYNARKDGFFRGLIKPTDAEQELNGFKLKRGKIIDAEKQVFIALDAFMKNRYFVLVDNKQVEDLEQIIEIHPYTSASFIKLTPLVGG